MNKISAFIRKYKFNNISIPLCIFLIVYVFEIMSNQYGLISVPYDFIEEVLTPIEFIPLWLMIIPDLLSFPLITKEKIIFLGIFAFAYYNFHVTCNTSLYFVILFCFAIRHERFEDVIDFLSKVMGTYIILMIVYWFVCAFILKNGTASLPNFEASRFRFAFDIGHYNCFGQYLCSIVGIRLYLDYKKSNKVFIFSIIISLFTLFFISSRTAFIGQAVIIVLFAIIKKYDFLDKPLKIGSYIAFPACAAALNVLTLLYSKGTKIGLFFNKLLSTRLSLNALAFQRLNVSFFGTDFSFNDYLDGGFMDSLYPYLALKYGFIWLIIISIGFIIITKKGDVRDYIMIIVFALYAMSEHTIMNFVYMFILLLMSKVFAEDPKNG